MKKLTYLSALVLAAGMTACSQYEEPNPQIPVTPQETILNVDGITVAPSSYLSPNEETGALATIDLDAYSKLGYDIKMADVTVDQNEFPAGYELYFKTWIANNDQFIDAQEVPCTLTNGVITTTAADLQAVYEKMYGRKADPQEMWVRYAGYVQSADVNNVRLKGSDYWYGTQNFILSPVIPNFVVESAYYVLGTINGWDNINPVKMNHSDLDPMDDPVFTLVVDITAADIAANSGWWWKVIPESAVGTWDGLFGTATNGDPEPSGQLIENGEAGALQTPGKYVMTINLEMLTYDFAPYYEYLYTPGDGNGWNQLASAKIYPDPTGIVFQSWIPLQGAFKFTTAADWNGINYGAGDGENTLTTDPSAGNLNCPGAAGLYNVRLNISNLTWEVLSGPVQSWGVIGGFPASGWGTDVEMTPDADKQVWTATVTFGEGGEAEFKFRADGAVNGWDIQYGNSGDGLDNLSNDGGSGNLVAPAPGTYKVTLDLRQVPVNATLEAI